MKLTEIAKAKKELNLEHLANQVYDAFKRHPLGKDVYDTNRPKMSDKSFYMDFRDWGLWQNPGDAHDEEDYDWQDMTAETRKAAEAVCANMEKTFPGINVSYTAGEKNYLEVRVSLK